jgi:chitin disaccharide deacetylase
VSTPGSIKLVVRGDDFGMCHAVNQGIKRAFTDGIVTTSSTMAPCPWFSEAAEIAGDIGIPLGVHQTLTCEWGTFRPSVELAHEHVEHTEAVAELLAQVERFSAAGLGLDYLDHHMGSVLASAYPEVAERTGIPFLYTDETLQQLATFEELSPRDAAGKKAWMLDYLRSLTPGVHLLVCHPGVVSSELDSLTGPDSVPYLWAADYRNSDLEVVTDPEVKGLIEELGIELCSFPEALQSMAA